MNITLPYRWEPRSYQRPLWAYLRDGGTRAVVCAHRRWGKDDLCLHHTACAAHERIGNYAHMLPEYAQGRKAIWDAVNPHSGVRRIDEAFPLLLRENTNDQEMKIRLKCGSTWQVTGSDNYNSLMGTSLAGIVKSEEALSNPSAWGYLSPILRENGGWCIFISTPRGHNHFEALLKTARREASWYADVSPASETDVFTQGELDDELRQLQDLHGEAYGRSLWMQEYFCSFDAAIPGSIWGDAIEKAQTEGRILDFPLDPKIPVDTGWDLGRTDDTAIWFRQICGRDLNVVDHHSSNGKDIPFYVDLLLDKAKTHDLTYGTHWLPHDARPRTLAAGGKSILQQFQDAAHVNPRLGRFAIVPRLDVQEGIQAARKTLPYCRFHQTRCEKGLTSLRQYHRAWDDDKKMFLDHPEHDWASHDADAFRSLALSWKFARPEKPAESPLVDQLMAANPTAQTWGQMTKAFFAKKRHDRTWGLARPH